MHGLLLSQSWPQYEAQSAHRICISDTKMYFQSPSKGRSQPFARNNRSHKILRHLKIRNRDGPCYTIFENLKKRDFPFSSEFVSVDICSLKWSTHRGPRDRKEEKEKQKIKNQPQIALVFVVHSHEENKIANDEVE